ncbi:MAG: PD-(D/E)XK nuclease family transposase [Bacteroidales bacterium]|nr:PD-(D/E)XK nuclease family transposase [Bacteroidales bacterium]
MGIYQKRYVPLTTDAGFKAVFADRANKPLLIRLLNNLLPEGVIVKDIVEYCDREQCQDTILSKKTVLDLICRGDDGSQFIVEVQNRPYLQLGQGEDYVDLHPVYVVSILNHKLRHHDERQWDKDCVVSHYEFMEIRTKEVAPMTISITFAELARFAKTLDECSSEQDYLFYWFINGGNADVIPDAIKNRAFVSQLAGACEYAALTKEHRLRFEANMINELDILYGKRQEFKNGREEGFAAGMVEGEIKGEAKGIRKMALAMKNAGMQFRQISEMTGLSELEVAEL